MGRWTRLDRRYNHNWQADPSLPPASRGWPGPTAQGELFLPELSKPACRSAHAGTTLRERPRVAELLVPSTSQYGVGARPLLRGLPAPVDLGQVDRKLWLSNGRRVVGID
jgi:hypothetical protein